MRNVVSFCEARAARLKQRLSALAARREGAIVRGREGRRICASRIFCRDQVVVLIDRYGFQNRLGYDDILDAVPVARVAAEASPVRRMEELAGTAAGAEALDRRSGTNVIMFPLYIA